MSTAYARAAAKATSSIAIYATAVTGLPSFLNRTPKSRRLRLYESLIRLLGVRFLAGLDQIETLLDLAEQRRERSCGSVQAGLVSAMLQNAARKEHRRRSEPGHKRTPPQSARCNFPELVHR